MSGKGRGRGWLKLEKPLDPPVGIPPNQTVTMSDVAPSPTKPPSQGFDKIVHAISQFNDNDDGILINQKFNYIKELMTDECKTKEEFAEMFNSLHETALSEDGFTMKYTMFVTLNSFRDLVLCNTQVRSLLLTKMQMCYNDASTLQETNPTMFYNSIRLLAGFYNKANMLSNSPYRLLVGPLLSYMNMLIDTGKPEDIEMFTKQLHLNGKRIFESCGNRPKLLSELVVKARNLLISCDNLTETSKAWLLLAIDLDTNCYGILSAELLNYYKTKLGDQEVLNLQKLLSVLSVQTTQPNKALKKFQSNVNVLLMDVQKQQQQQQKVQAKPEDKLNHQAHDVSLKLTKTKNDEMYSTWQTQEPTWQSREPNEQKTPSVTKAGRPILGSGARNQTDDQWINQSKENASGWMPAQKNLEENKWGDRTLPPAAHNRVGKINKGWEHDDRFQADY